MTEATQSDTTSRVNDTQLEQAETATNATTVLSVNREEQKASSTQVVAAPDQTRGIFSLKSKTQGAKDRFG